MRRLLLCLAALFAASVVMLPRQVQAQDALEFATPIVNDVSPACESGQCQTTAARTTYVHHRRTRPVVRWFRHHQPVRRALRGAARLIRLRCCR